jgi:hypothetical protein
MTYAAFRKDQPATRCFERYDSETRANHAASGRLGFRQREAAGAFYYTHPLVPGVAFPTAKAATERAYEIHCVGEVCAWLNAA